MRIHTPLKNLLITFPLAIAFPVFIAGLTLSAVAVATNSSAPLFLPAVTYDSGKGGIFNGANSVAVADVNACKCCPSGRRYSGRGTWC